MTLRRLLKSNQRGSLPAVPLTGKIVLNLFYEPGERELAEEEVG